MDVGEKIISSGILGIDKTFTQQKGSWRKKKYTEQHSRK
jgi:hypothetical protein